MPRHLPLKISGTDGRTQGGLIQIIDGAMQVANQNPDYNSRWGVCDLVNGVKEYHIWLLLDKPKEIFVTLEMSDTGVVELIQNIDRKSSRRTMPHNQIAPYYFTFAHKIQIEKEEFDVLRVTADNPNTVVTVYASGVIRDHMGKQETELPQGGY